MPPQWSATARFWITTLGAGVLSGLLHYMSLRGMPWLLAAMYFVQLPLFLVGLSLGLTASALASLTAAVTTGVMASHWLWTAIFALSFAPPVLVIVRQALLSRPAAGRGMELSAAGRVEWYPPGLLTGWLVAVGVAIVLAASGALLLSGGVETQVTEMVGRFIDAIQKIMPSDLRIADPERAVAETAAYLPGTAAASLLVMTVVNALLAQLALQRLDANLRPAPDIAELDLPVAVVVLFAAAAALGLLLPGDLGYVARNLAPVALVGAVLSGLAIVHAAVRRLGSRRWLLIAVYAATVLVMWPVFMLAAVGLAEPFLKLRRRLAGV